MSDDCTYMKLATNNYNEINASKKNYCIYCYGGNKKLNESIISINEIYWISDKNGLTGGCKKCSVDAIIPGNYFMNNTENEIHEQMSIWYKQGFT